MIVVDTTVLTYAVGEEHALREPCRRLLAAHGERHIELNTTIEVVQEFTHVRARRRPRPEAVRWARTYAAALDLITTSSDDLERGLDLFERYPALGAFDAVLAAVALGRRAQALVSADRAFSYVPQLHWIDPASSDLGELIRG